MEKKKIKLMQINNRKNYCADCCKNHYRVSSLWLVKIHNFHILTKQGNATGTYGKLVCSGAQGPFIQIQRNHEKIPVTK